MYYKYISYLLEDRRLPPNTSFREWVLAIKEGYPHIYKYIKKLTRFEIHVTQRESSMIILFLF